MLKAILNNLVLVAAISIAHHGEAKGAAPAGPVYLNCTTLQSGKPVPWQITLDESRGTAEYDIDTGQRLRRPANFTADKVFFIGFTLSRVDLTLERYDEYSGWERGRCQIAKSVDRVF